MIYNGGTAEIVGGKGGMAQQNKFGRRPQATDSSNNLRAQVSTVNSADSSIFSTVLFAAGMALLAFLAGQVYFAEKEQGILSGMWISWNLVETDKSSDQIQLKFGSTEKLQPRSSFASLEEFENSGSFETGVLAFKALPLALQCKNVMALISLKLIIGSVAEKMPNQIIQKLMRDMKRSPELYSFSPQDCNDRLPAMMRSLKRRI